MAKILIVEDEKNIARFVELELMHEQHEVTVCYDGRTGLDTALRSEFDLILLDIMLPGLSGLEILRRLRQAKSSVPIIMLTAKDDISDRVAGLDSGADDYLTKPFAIEELLARIRRSLRSMKSSEVITFGQLSLSPSRREVSFGDTEIELTKTEFDLLHYFLMSPGRVLTRDEIMNAVWGYDFIGDTNIVDVYVRYLRSKIDERFGVKLIQTVRGVGYRFYEEDAR
ncbi:MAG TPA: response regulator transcription factor [Tissierellia bacterium]|nr:response regulator transcription factor [Tissierellia bacterium]